MSDLKERLHQIACCEGECRENRIEAWERIAELEAQLDAVREVIPILEEAGDYCDCGCGTHHAELVKAALNGEDDE